MNIRNAGIKLATLIFIGVLCLSCYSLATAASKKGALAPAFLSQAYLRGSMQGKSGAALDLDGDGHEDLVIGAPYARHKGIDRSRACLSCNRQRVPETPHRRFGGRRQPRLESGIPG